MNVPRQSISNERHPKVFISYSHDSFEHINRVLELSNHLRLDGVDCSLDQYEVAPAEGWAHWTESQIEESDFVILVCTKTYSQRFKAAEEAGQGLGVKWEGAVIRKHLYDAGAKNKKFVPVIFSGSDDMYVPSILGAYTYFNLEREQGYKDLFRWLTNQPSVVKPELGKLRAMPPLERSLGFFVGLEEEENGESEPPHDLQLILAAQQRTVEEYSDGFVGREYARRAFERFMAQRSRGYFIVRSNPGLGKTAVAASLVKAHECISYFISRTAGRSDARLILRALIAQMVKLSQIQTMIYDSLPALIKTFGNLLAEVATRRRRLILIIDALDELADDEDGHFAFLSANPLPEGVYVCVTSRPGNRLDEFEEDLAPPLYEVYDLEPLEADEARGILRLNNPGLSAAEVARIVEASQGNPLFLRAITEELERDPAFDLREAPASVEGFFRRATKDIRNSRSQILLRLLGVLAVARKPLTMGELSGIISERQRDVYEQGIDVVRPFLLERDGSYRFYHARFQDYVARELVYEDEQQNCHRLIAEWLRRPENIFSEYSLSSLAYHLFQAGGRKELYQVLGWEFLVEKTQRLGYGVLEDLELLTKAMFESREVSLISKIIESVELLRIDKRPAAGPVWLLGPGDYPFHPKPVEPSLPPVAGLDVYVGMLPKENVSADFFEVIPSEAGLVLAVGDAPRLGLKSAFVARFVSNLFRTTAARLGPFRLAEVLHEMAGVISAHEYFNWVSMQCVEIDLKRGIFAIASAAHPFPVLYSARRRKCSNLPVRGEILHSSPSAGTGRLLHEQRHAEIYPGDVLVMMTDGLLESHILAGDPYGYRFTLIIERMHGQSAEAIGRAILDDWRAHKHSYYTDDVTILVVAVREGQAAPHHTA